METCLYCQKTFKKITSTHKARCSGWPKLPPPPPCLCGHVAKSLTTMKRHRKTCDLWKNRNHKSVSETRRKQTNLVRYGVEDASQHPDVVARRKQTNLERYGCENPMHHPEIAKKAQENGGGPPPPSYGSDNAFADPEVQKKIKATMLEKYGAENPQQVPEIREKTRQTNWDRYGHKEILAVPEIRDKIRSTCEDRYGGPAPSCDPEVVEKARHTNLDRWGVEWTGQVPEFRQKQLDTMIENYGSHFFASDEGKEAVRQRMLEKYGVCNPAKMPGHWGKVGPKKILTCREKYGFDHPMQNEEVFLKQRLSASTSQTMNGLEAQVFEWCPNCVEYTGNGIFWRRLPNWNGGQYKNPDFIIVPFRDSGCRVIEVLGDYFHSLHFKGRTAEEYQHQLTEAYADVGITCLILWESEIKSHPKRVKERLRRFVGG